MPDDSLMLPPAVGLQGYSGTEPRATVDAAKAPSTAMEVEQDGALAVSLMLGREETDVLSRIESLDVFRQSRRLVSALPYLL